MDDQKLSLRLATARRVVMITSAAIGSSLLATALAYLLIDGKLGPLWPNFVIATLVPAIVAPLTSWRIVALSEQLRIANEHLHTLSGTDPLTRTLNRRRFFEIFEQQLAVAARHCYPTTLLLIDFDHFKQINDRFGHVVGDQVLVESTDRMRAVCRESDALARFGGEEFVMLLPHTARNGAEVFAGRIMEALRDLVIHDPESGLPIVGLDVTVTIGGVTCEASDADADLMMSRADALLYAAKQAGRDRCFIETLAQQPQLQLAGTAGR